MNYEVTELEAMCVEEGPPDLRERTKVFALRIIKLFASLPKSAEGQVLGKQVLRSGTSVGAKTRVLSMLKQRAERGEGGMANKEIRAITHYGRNQVIRLMHELQGEAPQIKRTGHGAGSRYLWGESMHEK